MRLKIERSVSLIMTVESDEIIRRFSSQWEKFKGENDIEEGDEVYDQDYEEFFLRLGNDYGWNDVFGNGWDDDQTDVSVWEV